MAMSMLPSQAPSIRTCATRLPPASTTAMFIGWPISVAWVSPAARTRLASASETVCCSFTSCVFLVSGRVVTRGARAASTAPSPALFVAFREQVKLPEKFQLIPVEVVLSDQAVFDYDDVTIAHAHLLARCRAPAVGCLQISGIRP